MNDILIILLASIGVLLGYLALTCIGKLQHRILILEDALMHRDPPEDPEDPEGVENE